MHVLYAQFIRLQHLQNEWNLVFQMGWVRMGWYGVVWGVFGIGCWILGAFGIPSVGASWWASPDTWQKYCHLSFGRSVYAPDRSSMDMTMTGGGKAWKMVRKVGGGWNWGDRGNWHRVSVSEWLHSFAFDGHVIVHITGNISNWMPQFPHGMQKSSGKVVKAIGKTSGPLKINHTC